MQAEVDTEVAAGQPKKRTFKKFSFRGVDLDALLDMSTDELVKLFNARARRRSNPFLYLFRYDFGKISFLYQFAILCIDTVRYEVKFSNTELNRLNCILQGATIGLDIRFLLILLGLKSIIVLGGPRGLRYFVLYVEYV